MSENKTAGSRSFVIGSDHAGYLLKQELIEGLRSEGFEPQDYGAFSLESMDYPDIALKVAQAVASGQFDKGILICGTGIGVTITANKVRGIRAAACSEPYSAMMARRHNNANILGMGGRVVGPGLAIEIAKAFLNAEFEGGRHARRVDKINAIDSGKS